MKITDKLIIFDVPDQEVTLPFLLCTIQNLIWIFFHAKELYIKFDINDLKIWLLAKVYKSHKYVMSWTINGTSMYFYLGILLTLF